MTAATRKASERDDAGRDMALFELISALASAVHGGGSDAFIASIVREGLAMIEKEEPK